MVMLARQPVYLTYQGTRIRRARDGPLEDMSRRPKRTPNRIDQALESLVVEEAKRTGFRYRRLSSYIQRKYSIKISENTIKVILKEDR